MPSAVAEILTVSSSLILVFALAGTIGIAWVVLRDAQERGVSEAIATVWELGVAYLIPIVTPLYLVFVVRSRSRETAVMNRERWLIGFSFSFVFSFISTAITTPPDSFTQVLPLLIVLPW